MGAITASTYSGGNWGMNSSVYSGLTQLPSGRAITLAAELLNQHSRILKYLSVTSRRYPNLWNEYTDQPWKKTEGTESLDGASNNKHLINVNYFPLRVGLLPAFLQGNPICRLLSSEKLERYRKITWTFFKNQKQQTNSPVQRPPLSSIPNSVFNHSGLGF